MKFESKTTSGIGLITALSELTGGELKDGKVTFPETFGKGYMKFFDLGPLIKMMVNQSQLKEELVLRRKGSELKRNEIIFSFRNIFPTGDSRLMPAVQVSSSDIDIEISIPAGTKINTIMVIVHADLLKELINKGTEHLLLQNIISGNQPYLYDEIISPEIQAIAAEIIALNENSPLGDFYLKLKAGEMIYLFFLELLKRQNKAGYPLNVSDVKKMYLVRDKVVSDLGIPPDLTELTRLSNMSESKLNRLFRQIFGNSIYNYYQTLRMNEAAYLIKEKKLSVSEAGYRLGFTNLSHFTRIFERHLGLKPKKYAQHNAAL
ncbi:helix-turn-helix domain-containing protein [Pedobacter cryoconitis]|uniref:AraC-like DNA-binding protein n=1 Tax=Pedobacter cryoconitis TaxID=188932 RepID=A0A327SBE6_9SPHI|nr:AraC family transcriptional regulator [Pedobacter cryoconitis]RAJ26356.1 AraC-like DNA-binding protein [Pedobacter cryoconitis]